MLSGYLLRNLRRGRASGPPRRDVRSGKGRDMNSDIWAITTFFNPLGYRTRPANFRRFRERLNVPLAAIELSFDGTMTLGGEDADILVQLNSGSLLWQKERLLNLILKRLPRNCDIVAWLDCDILFARRDWTDLTRRKLEDSRFIQLFEEVCDLPQGFPLDEIDRAETLPKVASTTFLAERGLEVAAGLRSPEHRSGRSSANGLAWAARRELFEERGFYDACILGSGDRAMVGAALGEYDAIREALFMNGDQERHYLEWAIPFHDEVGGRIGCTEGTVFHLWHGDPSRRQLATRYGILEPFDFDPYRDVAVGDEGCWEWSTPKEGMHRAVRDYFLSRREDG